MVNLNSILLIFSDHFLAKEMQYGCNQKAHPRNHNTGEEDIKLIHIVESSNDCVINWKEVARKMKNRNSRQCKDRWEKYLNPNLSVQPWTIEEDNLIKNLYNIHGPKWKLISTFFKNRTDIMIRNRWNALHRKALKKLKSKNNTICNSINSTEQIIKEKNIEILDQNQHIDKNDEYLPFFSDILSEIDNENFMF